MKKAVKAFWLTFKDKPMRMGIGIFLIMVSAFMFFGDVKFKASHGDTKVEISTEDK